MHKTYCKLLATVEASEALLQERFCCIIYTIRYLYKPRLITCKGDDEEDLFLGIHRQIDELHLFAQKVIELYIVFVSNFNYISSQTQGCRR